jgi:hypothetical protein
MKRAIPSLALAAVTCALALGGASPAMADSYSINLSGPASVVVGQPVLIQASGVNPPPDQYWSASWIDVVAIPGRNISACPPSAQDGLQVAPQLGGAILDIALRPNLDETGSYTNQIGLTPIAPGALLICAYEDDGAGLTLSRASFTLNIEAASSPAPAPVSGGPAPSAGGGPSSALAAKPQNTKRPRVSRSGKKLTCNPGTWSNGATGYSYRWLVDGKQKKGATSSKLGLTRKVRGRDVKCGVTASNAAGATSATSKALHIGS